MSLSQRLQDKLDTIGFYGDFEALGIQETEALALDNASLMRRINKVTGVEAACEAAIASQTLEKNQQLHAKISQEGFSRILI